MEKTSGENPGKTLPFENLYLVSGLVNGFNKGWMYLFTILFLIFGYVSFQFMTLYPLASRLKQNGYSELEIQDNPNLLFDSIALGFDRNYVFLLELGMFVFAFAGFYIGIRLIHQKSLTSILSGYERFRYGRVFFAIAVWTFFVTAGTLVEYFLSPGNFQMNINVTGLIFSVLIAIVLMPIQSGLEELLFRGYMMQGLALIFKNGIIPLIITSLLFGLAHMGNPEAIEYGRPVMLFYYGSFALFMGAITLLDEGLELALGIHIANNVVSGILVSDPHSVIKSYSILESSHTNPWIEIALWFAMAGLTFFIFRLRYRWRNFRLIIR